MAMENQDDILCERSGSLYGKSFLYFPMVLFDMNP